MGGGAREVHDVEQLVGEGRSKGKHLREGRIGPLFECYCIPPPCSGHQVGNSVSAWFSRY